MRRRMIPKATKLEESIIREIERSSAFELLERGRAKLLSPREYPEPIKRFLKRERLMVHVKLTPSIKRKLEARSRKAGVPVDVLARRCIEQGLMRNAG